MRGDEITGTLALLKPDDLYPAWKWINLMERWGLRPDDVMRPGG